MALVADSVKVVVTVGANWMLVDPVTVPMDGSMTSSVAFCTSQARSVELPSTMDAGWAVKETIDGRRAVGLRSPRPRARRWRSPTGWSR